MSEPTHPQAATFEVSYVEDAGDMPQVRIRLDRPGVSAVSYVGDAHDLLRQIAEAAGLEIDTRPEGATAD